MWILAIILFLVLGIWLWKHILFNPRVNSVFTIYCILCLIVGGELTVIMFLLYVAVIVDCIRDIKIAKTYYRDMEDGVDPFYAMKSLLSLFTLGLARVVFLVFADRFITASASSDIDEMLRKYKMIPYGVFKIPKYTSSLPSKLFSWQYGIKYKEIIQEKLREGIILSNVEIIDNEFQIYREKLEKSYPKKIVEKVGEIISAEGKNAEIEREHAKKEILKLSDYYVYVEKKFYDDCKEKISGCLVHHGTLSPYNIAQVPELKNINVLQKNVFEFPLNWVKYMVIFMIQPLVKGGVVEECNISDAILENHQYKHIKGLPMLVRNAEDDPRLALDDD